MTLPVDITNLREITGGDVEMETELFKEFITTCDSYIMDMGNMLDADKYEPWRTTAHAFKGIAINLGAAHLSELCKKAQENNTYSPVEKVTMLENIKHEYEAVKNFLHSIMPT